MRSFVLGLLAVACFSLVADDADARIFRGCNSNGCSTSGCSTNSGCNVVRRNADPVQISNPAPRPVVTNPAPTPPPQIVKGDKGEKGDPGQITTEQLEQIVQQVTGNLLTIVKSDPAFRGSDGNVDPAAIAAQVKGDILANHLDDIASHVKLPDVNVAAIAKATVQEELSRIATSGSSGNIVYVTARGQSNLIELDRQVQTLKSNGLPVVVITLNPKQVNVEDAPKLYDGNTRQTYSGVQDISQYVASLGRRVSP